MGQGPALGFRATGRAIGCGLQGPMSRSAGMARRGYRSSRDMRTTAPPEVSNVNDNMRAAAEYSPLWLLGMVPNRHPWDYKQQGRKYEAFGNFDYGAVTAASGLPDAVSLRGAGWAQQQAGTSKRDGSFGSPFPGTKSFG